MGFHVAWHIGGSDVLVARATFNTSGSTFSYSSKSHLTGFFVTEIPILLVNELILAHLSQVLGVPDRLIMHEHTGGVARLVITGKAFNAVRLIFLFRGRIVGVEQIIPNLFRVNY